VDVLREPVELIDQDLDEVVGGNNLNVGIVLGNAIGTFSEQENTIAQVNVVAVAAAVTDFLNG